MIKYFFLIFIGFITIAAGYSDTPVAWKNYWSSPTATAQNTHDWSALEKNMRPEACAQCHEAQFNAWKHSRHSKAFSPGLVGQFPGMGHKEGNDCLRCHAPLQEQLYDGDNTMFKSLASLYLQPHGINNDADLDSKQAKLPLRHAGVTCAVCHVRSGNRFGPVRKGTQTLGHLKGDTHGGFTALKEFEQSNFCAECHQFPQDYAINGKPLENTVFEWQQSRFAKAGKQCQGCHMPDRTHSFKGIHDKKFTRQGLSIQTQINNGIAALKITSKNIGHAFPTYVTPKIIIHATALDQQGKNLKSWQWEIVREVLFNEGWKEKRDTRLMPGESRVYNAKQAPKEADSIQFDIKVIPDHFYKGVYKGLLSYQQNQGTELLIQRALDDSANNDYTLFSKSVALP
ncbi:MAG: multiheme c-type cytochrome [Ghiorsea sp.]